LEAEIIPTPAGFDPVTLNSRVQYSSSWVNFRFVIGI